MKTYKGLDPSNKDSADGGAKINMAKWNIYGMLMPDTIASYKASDGVEYIVTANEGDDKEYEWETSDGTTVWTEMIRGKDMADAGLSVRSSAGVTDADLADQKKLGLIKCGWFDGRGSNFTEKKFEKISAENFQYSALPGLQLLRSDLHSVSPFQTVFITQLVWAIRREAGIDVFFSFHRKNLC